VSEVLTAIADVIGEGVRIDELTRTNYGRDWWARSALSTWLGEGDELPMAVIFPRNTGQMAKTVRICRAAGVRMVPRGAGSGVCGGVLADGRSVVLSTDLLTGLRAFDAYDHVATFGAGTVGSDAEEAVARRGFTIGHWPQSIDRSSVGGWVATRASGQYSTGYGNIEDLVYSLEAVLPDGTVYRSRDTPRAAAGPDLRHLLIGSEGTLGIVTEVSFVIRPQPEQSLRQAFHFENFAAGIEATREVIVPGWRPNVVRLYDARESARHFRDTCPSGRCMLIFLHEGPAPRAEIEAEAVRKLCRRHGGQPGDPAAVDAWFEHRNEVPSWRQLFDEGLVVDTIEVATGWSRIVPLYEAVITALQAEPSLMAASAHSSHAYQSGANLYFTFVTSPERSGEMLEVYDRCWNLAMRATRDVGASIAHHHGIGRVRRDWLPGEIGPAGVRMLRSVKRVLDPDDLMNPGVLIPTG
jgi:alkyldihydroxyacetonephosphate synthase